MSQQPIFIRVLQPQQPLVFAAGELRKYLRLMGIENVRIDAGEAHPAGGWRIHLGLFSDFGFDLPQGSIPEFDDHLRVNLTQNPGIIAGSNPRSVLLAVYRLLVRTGCRFIRPGKDGEIIPVIDPSDLRIEFDESPSYRHRGMCIEGAVSLEHMLASVDWAPKVGLNAYFLEFMLPFTFFDRWYRHLNNPTLQPEPVSVDQVAAFRKQIEQEIGRRGLLYHNPGHGWTCEPLGLQGLGWDSTTFDLPGEITQNLAEVDGVRAVFHGIPLNTQLCYSNPLARKKVVEYAVQYMRDNPLIDFLHVWLADDANNFCECENCRGLLPSDQYIQLLNEIDAAFTANQIACRIVFVAYLDLLWPPKTQILAHPERFFLLFAPISRSYSQSYDLQPGGLPMQEYQRNRNLLPSGTRENLLFLQSWQKFFQGDSFTYEYYFMWDHYLDPGYINTARILHEDIQKLHQVGLNGLMSDQTQRAYFPTGFGMHVMARTLWDAALDFNTLAEDYFYSDFGLDGVRVQQYLAQLSGLFNPPYLRGETEPQDETSHVRVLNAVEPILKPSAAQMLSLVPALVEQFRPTIERNLADANPCRAKSWLYLAHHAEIVVPLARAFAARALGQKDEARGHWQTVRAYVQQHEVEMHNVLDVFEFITVLQARFPDNQ